TVDLRASCFDVTAQGRALHLVLGRPVPGAETVELSYLRGTKAGRSWSHPVNIPTSPAVPGNHHRGNDPQIAVQGNHVMALWTAEGKGPFGSGPIGIALSDDSGKTWRAGPSPTPVGEGKEIGCRFPAAVAGDG